MRISRKASILAVLCLGAALATDRASAQMAVIDNSNLAQTTLAASRALNQLQQLTAQYNQLVATYQMLTNPVDVASMATGLNISTLQNPLPTVTGLNGMITGQTAPAGAGVTFFNQNHIYSPTDSSVASTQLIANGNSIANLQGVASTNLQAIQQRLALLPTLQASLTGAQSITEINAINGRIQLEANYAQAQQAQAQNLTVLALEQEASDRQKAQEEHAKEANAIADQYRQGAQ
jgi:type IV secretion system protein VirB5